MNAVIMKNVLKRYEKVSGQAINFNKSSVTFSLNTTGEERTRICEALGVEEVENPWRYLDIQMVVGRKKKDVFGFLTDTVKQKLKNWKSRKNIEGGKAHFIANIVSNVTKFLDEPNDYTC
ncbi:uncharacterized protein LOC141686127 [Apium graveolens]|uniref:uncharacterized protein LOC141686127 n=1 Tax=Apium graveolens TaxID=4045 RepID=UPI003D7B52BC